jgi:AraC family transcriptional regulator of adaptative response/methylated-DNA-[protein]-cysteine methyltransferase
LEDDLAARFPLARIRRDEAGLGLLIKQVLAQITEHPTSRALSLDVRATAFQRRVWEALQQIPRGQTRSYSQIAESIGQPSAVRAVARACSQNPVAVVVPCHRVVGKDGAITGYRWGIQRKQKLLALEIKSGLQSTK